MSTSWRNMLKISKNWMTFPEFMIKVAWNKKTVNNASPVTSAYITETINKLTDMANNMGPTLGLIITQTMKDWLTSYEIPPEAESKTASPSETPTQSGATGAFWDTLHLQTELDQRAETLGKRLTRCNTNIILLPSDSESEEIAPALPPPKKRKMKQPPATPHIQAPPRQTPPRGEGPHPWLGEMALSAAASTKLN